jgi:hypothetical protein
LYTGEVRVLWLGTNSPLMKFRMVAGMGSSSPSGLDRPGMKRIKMRINGRIRGSVVQKV